MIQNVTVTNRKELISPDCCSFIDDKVLIARNVNLDRMFSVNGDEVRIELEFKHFEIIKILMLKIIEYNATRLIRDDNIFVLDNFRELYDKIINVITNEILYQIDTKAIRDYEDDLLRTLLRVEWIEVGSPKHITLEVNNGTKFGKGLLFKVYK